MKPFYKENLIFKCTYIIIFSVLTLLMLKVIFYDFSLSSSGVINSLNVKDEGSEYLPVFFGYRVKLTDGLITIFTFCLVITSILQHIRMRETVAEMQASSEFTKQSAEAAVINAQALIKTQRAFIVSKAIRHVQQGDLVIFIHQWENTGATPSKKLYSQIRFSRRESPLPEDFIFEEDNTVAPVPFVAGPKEIKEMVFASFTKEELIRVYRQELYFYVWGFAKYHDIFDSATEHITKFCYQLNVDTMSTDNVTNEVTALGLGFQVYPRNNCADEECFV